MRRKFALALAAPVLATALVGCGMLPGQLGGGGEAEPSAESTGAAPEQSAAGAQPEQVKAIASRNVSHDGSKLRVDITGLKRQGKISTLTWTVTNLGAESESSWYVGAKFGTHVLDFTTAGVSLIDSVNGKRYRVARNGPGEDADCVCSKANQHLKGGTSQEYYAVYGAPPANVSKVNVEMGQLGVFSDVPVS